MKLTAATATLAALSTVVLFTMPCTQAAPVQIKLSPRVGTVLESRAPTNVPNVPEATDLFFGVPLDQFLRRVDKSAERASSSASPQGLLGSDRIGRSSPLSTDLSLSLKVHSASTHTDTQRHQASNEPDVTLSQANAAFTSPAFENAGITHTPWQVSDSRLATGVEKVSPGGTFSQPSSTTLPGQQRPLPMPSSFTPTSTRSESADGGLIPSDSTSKLPLEGEPYHGRKYKSRTEARQAYLSQKRKSSLLRSKPDLNAPPKRQYTKRKRTWPGMTEEEKELEQKMRRKAIQKEADDRRRGAPGSEERVKFDKKVEEQKRRRLNAQLVRMTSEGTERDSGSAVATNSRGSSSSGLAPLYS